MVCGGLRWFVVDCGGLSFSHTHSVYPALPVSFGGDSRSRWSLLSGVLPGEVKDPTSPHWNV